VAQACSKVTGFNDLYKRFEKRMHTSGRSESTLKNYSRYISQISLHFNCLPTDLEDDQIEDYLHGLLREGLTDKRIALPSIQKEKKLPIVLSRDEVKAMLKEATLLKHKLLIGLLYGCGLRCAEVRSILLKDIDLDRRTLLVRQGKGNKDRYVPLGIMLVRGIKSYIDSENITASNSYLFTGQDYDSRYSQRGVQWAVKTLSKKAGILKDVNVHTLRHSYATHLLEDGLNIVSIKNLLGQANIETTMVYLHIAQSDYQKPFSPLDKLYEQKD
jgi:site-specific recombinase XerD